ncbi:MAG: DciA family protein [Kiritimatiellae bacterium]|nr:DciA family protein [Kiritimatiellia bacterium]
MAGRNDSQMHGAAPPLRTRSRWLPPVDSALSLPVDADPPERRRPPEALGQTVGRLLKRYRLPEEGQLQPLLRLWPELAGANLTPRLRPGKLDRNVLYLYVRNSTELFELRRTALRDLEARIRSHPELRHIRQVRLQIATDG